MRAHAPQVAIEAVPTTFQVGSHAVIVSVSGRRWAVTVDAAPLPGTFETQVEAWEAGVREAARLDAPRP